MADTKLSALSATCSLAVGDYLYAVLDPTGSPLSRHIALSDFESQLPNRVTEGANIGTGLQIFREKSGTSLILRTITGGVDVGVTSATSLITITSEASARITTGDNVGTGIEAFREKSGGSLQFRTLAGGKDITVSSAASLITIANDASAHSMSFTIGTSNTWNNELIPVFQGPRSGSFTLIEIDATTSGTTTPTLAFNFQRRDFGAMNSAGTDIFAASQTADADGLSQTSFATSVVGPKNHIMFTTGSGAEGGSVNYVTFTFYYTR